MNDEHDEKLESITERIARGEYEVDAKAVAEAMLRRPGLAQMIGAAPFRVVVRGADEIEELARREETEAAQDKCSYPTSSASPPGPVSISLGAPESTRPTQVIVTGSGSEASALPIAGSSSAAAHTQSS